MANHASGLAWDVLDALEGHYGHVPIRRHGDPVSELVGTVLSQHTSDVNTARAYASLRATFPAWEAVIDAPTNVVEESIRIGGLARQKAPRIQRILHEVRERYGGFDLSPLASMPVREARKELVSLHGVGPKTASCVLLFSLGMPALPVDTHVYRVAKRLGLITARVSEAASHEALEAQLNGTAEDLYSFHMLMIRHGRQICKAARPRCAECPLLSLCPTGQVLLGTAVNSTPTA